MPTIQILVRVKDGVVRELAPPPPPPPPPPPQNDLGRQWVFSEDAILERYDDSTPGNGLPSNENQRRAGTQSGLVTVVRVVAANDPYFSSKGFLMQYVGT